MGGPTTTTNYNQAGNTTQQYLNSLLNSSTVTPNLPGWYSSLLQGIPKQYGALQGQLAALGAQSPYGPRQQANFQQGLNTYLDAAQRNLTSQLASRGALNSSRAGQMATQLALGGAQELGNYLAQTPALNAQFQSGLLGQQGNLLGNLQNLRVPYGESSNQVGAQGGQQSAATQQEGQQSQQTSGGLGEALLGGLLGAGLNFATGGLGNILGGGSFLGGGGGSTQSVMPTNSFNLPNLPPVFSAPTIYPWQTGGAGMPPGFGVGGL